jgi:hypothetical protein
MAPLGQIWRFEKAPSISCLAIQTMDPPPDGWAQKLASLAQPASRTHAKHVPRPHSGLVAQAWHVPTIAPEMGDGGNAKLVYFKPAWVFGVSQTDDRTPRAAV